LKARLVRLGTLRQVAWLFAAGLAGGWLLVLIRLPYAHELYAALAAICRMRLAYGGRCASQEVPSQAAVVSEAAASALGTYAAMAIPPVLLALAGRRRTFFLPLVVPAIVVLAWRGPFLDLRELLAGFPVTFMGAVRFTTFVWLEPLPTAHPVLGGGLVIALALLPAMTLVARGREPSKPDLDRATLSAAGKTVGVSVSAVCALVVFAIGNTQWGGSSIRYGWDFAATWFCAAVSMFVFAAVLGRPRYWFAEVLLVAILASGWTGPPLVALLDSTQGAVAVAYVLRAVSVLLLVGVVGSSWDLLSQVLWGGRGSVLRSRRYAEGFTLDRQP
jgi:hypothetical protein